MTMSDNPQPDKIRTLFDLFNEIGIVNQLSSTRFDRVLPEGLTRSQFSVLNNFVRLGGTRTPLQLARAFQVTKGAMTNTLKRLQARGSITLSVDPADKRGKIVKITKSGRALRERAIKVASAELAEVAALFNGAQIDDRLIDDMLSNLRKIRELLDNARN
jgi:DNA-binding MarR family transcriptional regulator